MVTKLLRSETFYVEFVAVLYGGIMTTVLGTWIPLMTTLIVLNATDVASGLLKGGIRKNIGSNIFFQGIKKKVSQWLLIIVANAVDNMAFDNIPVAKTGVVSYLIATEGISITENLAQMGAPIPDFITKYLIQIRDINNDKDLNNYKKT